MKLTFKKAFGFDFMPSDAGFWMLELGKVSYVFAVRETPVTIRVGTFGRTPQEQYAIDLFMTTGNRPFDREIMTIDVELDVVPVVLDEMLPRASEHGVADAVVSQWVDTAFIAIQKFLETYRDCKYLKYRGTDRWNKNQTLVPQMTEHEFNTFLFYILEADPSHTFVGSFSKGRMLMSESNDGDFSSALQGALRERVPLLRQLIQIAWQRFLDEDYAGTVIYAALAIERALTGFLRAELSKVGAGTASQIDKVLEDTSNRLLCTVLLGVLGGADVALREQIVEVFNNRNSLAHGKRSGADRDEASHALNVAEAFFTVVRAV
jgi:hypothetical protein